MSFYGYQAPESWNGYRNVDEKINLDEIQRMLGEDDNDKDDEKRGENDEEEEEEWKIDA